MKRLKTFVPLLTFLILFLLFAVLSGAVLRPKYQGSVIEGNFTNEYYRDPTAHDLLILGSCESYANISTMKLWEDYGITSYIRGNSDQMIPQSYAMLCDALKRETPKAVLINVMAMSIAEQDVEAYNRMVFEDLKWSESKIEAMQATMMEGEHLLTYLLPVLRYHSRWSSLTGEDLRYAFSEAPVSTYQGYYLRADIRPAGEFPAERRREDYTFSAENYAYLEKIRSLCEERGIPLILMKAPSIYPEWVPPYEEQILQYAEQHDLAYYNFLELSDEIGIDMQTDTYDEGLHCNVYGAEKVAVYLGKELRDRFKLPDHRKESLISDYYDARLLCYNKEKASQKQEFDAQGYLSKYSETGE